MKKDVLITLVGTQNNDGEKDTAAGLYGKAVGYGR